MDMKKHLYASLLPLCLLLMLIPGCSEKDSPAKAGAVAENASIDVDLTILSSVMIYAEVSNIMTNPGDYLGKTLRISGPYYTLYYEETGSLYHYVIIEDVLACCAQGVEFLWNGDHAYPDDYPDDLERIEVIGVFVSYEEFGQIYYRIVVDEVAVY